VRSFEGASLPLGKFFTMTSYVSPLLLAIIAAADEHPTLPTMWTALVDEAGVGIVHESENFVDHGASVENPSAKWTNYTDGSCQRLIYSAGNTHPDTGRYLLGCEAVKCCFEDDDTSPIEYQIPNVHPASLAPVTNGGKETITTFAGSEFEETVEADVWTWKFTMEHFKVHTTPDPENADQALLHKWTVTIGEPIPNEYRDYRAIPESEAEAFKATFQIPEVCRGNILSCNGAHTTGLLSEEKLQFLRSGRAPGQAVHV